VPPAPACSIEEARFALSSTTIDAAGTCGVNGGGAGTIMGTSQKNSGNIFQISAHFQYTHNKLFRVDSIIINTLNIVAEKRANSLSST
jgi:hypothetical protein